MGAVRKSSRNIPLHLDPWIMIPALILTGMGLVMVASSSVAIAEKHDLPVYYYALKQLMACLIGFGLAFAALRIDPRNLERASPLLLPLAALALMLVFVPSLGIKLNGSRRWINLGFMQFQPVEAVKLLFVIYMAGYLVRRQDKVSESFRGIATPLATAALLSILLLGQPDFGGAVLILAITVTMLWVGGARFRDLAALSLLVLPPLIWLVLSEPYRVRRLMSFTDPWTDPYGDSFQLVQALIAIGRGEWFGVGLGGSVQKLFYLPEASTDFILAVLAEELGFVGVVGLMALYAILVGRGTVLAMRAIGSGHAFIGFTCFGLCVLIGMQAAVSFGVNLGALPTKGLTLPLVSAGGSSLMMTMLGMGFILRCGAEVRAAESAEADKPAKTKTKPKKSTTRKTAAKKAEAAA